MLNPVECPLPAVVTLDELPTNRTLKTVRDANGVVWVSLSSVAVAAHTYPSRLTSNLRAMSARPTLVDRPATNPTKRTKLESLTPLAHFQSVAANHSIGGTLYPDVRGPILTALRDGVASLYDGVPLPPPEVVRPPVANRLVEYETQENQGEESTMHDSCMVENGRQFGIIRIRDSDIPVALVGSSKMVSLRACADAVRLAMNGQLARLKKMGWATMRTVLFVGADGKKRDMVMIDRETFWGWIITIETGKIKDAATKDAVLWWQKNALRAIDAYFATNGPVDVQTHTTTADTFDSDFKGAVLKMADVVTVLMKNQMTTGERLDRLEGAVNRVLASA